MLFGKSEVTANALWKERGNGKCSFAYNGNALVASPWLHLHYSSAFHDFSNFHPNLSCTYIILLPHDKKTQTKEEQ